MIILVLNCGSSSMKYQVLDMQPNDQNGLVLAKGIVERIGLPEGAIVHRPSGKDKVEIDQAIENHSVGINKVLELLVSSEHGVIKSLDDIVAVGHRVAHGGEFFSKSVLVNDEVEIKIAKCIELAPLHNPANLTGIQAMRKLIPNVPQVACFDTSFHLTMPAHAFVYALPYKYYTDFKVRRYGFHGTSHKFVAQKVCKHLELDIEKTKIITCHLGNGSSITAIQNGKSVDTSMGFTPLEGLVMGTRCGDIDAGIILYLAEKENLSLQEVNDLLNKQSGLQGISGVSSDMRDLWAASEAGNPQAKLALDIFAYRVLKYIGSYAAAMGGVDVIAFTGGIGENDYGIRHLVAEKLQYLGVDFDAEKNDNLRGVSFAEINTPQSKTKIVVAATNEELVIATDTMNLVNNQ